MSRGLFFLLGLSISILNGGCNKTGTAMEEYKTGTYKFSSYTADTFRFRVKVNDQVLADSFISPGAGFTAVISFSNPYGRLVVTDTKNEQVVIDTAIGLKTGNSTISIVQFNIGERPVLAPIPNEPIPASGNVKLRFLYTRPSNSNIPFFDSVKCVIRTSGNVVLDTIVLAKAQATPYYEVPLGNTFSMRIFNPADNTLIDNTTNTLNSAGYPSFSTAIIYGSAVASPYNFLLQRVY